MYYDQEVKTEAPIFNYNASTKFWYFHFPSHFLWERLCIKGFRMWGIWNTPHIPLTYPSHDLSYNYLRFLKWELLDDVREVWGICEGSKISLTFRNPFIQRHLRIKCEGWRLFRDNTSGKQRAYCSLPVVADLIINRSRPRRLSNKPILFSNTQCLLLNTNPLLNNKRLVVEEKVPHWDWTIPTLGLNYSHLGTK